MRLWNVTAANFVMGIMVSVKLAVKNEVKLLLLLFAVTPLTENFQQR